jgi:ribosomal protein S17E
MKPKILITALLLIFVVKAFAQQKNLNRITDSIATEGKALYRSEWASWYGTDIFLDKCKDKRNLIGGYISYETKDGLNNVFFTKGDDPVVLGTTSFGTDLNPSNYKLDTTARKLNATEKELIDIRQKVVKRMATDTIFKYFNNTSLNAVPLIRNGVKRVYLLTGPKANGVVIFGNDYLVNFDRDNQITNIKRLHKNIIPIHFSKTAADSTVVGAMHIHLPETGDFITATDICTLMLYEKFTPWKQHIVRSKNYVSVWDCKLNKLTLMTAAEWEKDHPSKEPAKQ